MPAFDAVAAIFIQFAAPTQRAEIFAGMRTCVRPGGLVLLHSYMREQLDYRTGGPANADHLDTEEMLLCQAFGDWHILRLTRYERELTEGASHRGMSALTSLVARKPAG